MYMYMYVYTYVYIYIYIYICIHIHVLSTHICSANIHKFYITPFSLHSKGRGVHVHAKSAMPQGNDPRCAAPLREHAD